MRRGKQTFVSFGHLRHRPFNVSRRHPCALQPLPGVIVSLPLPRYGASDKYNKVRTIGPKAGHDPTGLRKPKNTNRDPLQLAAQGRNRAAHVNRAVSHRLIEPIPLRVANARFIPRYNRNACIKKSVDEWIVTLLRCAILWAIPVNQNHCRGCSLVRQPERTRQEQSICFECKRLTYSAIQTIGIKTG